jgi:hypothetical protein
VEFPASLRIATSEVGRASDVGNGRDEFSAVALVGMDGLVVTGHLFRDGDHWLAIETRTSRAWCPDCGVRAVGNGRRQVCVGVISDRWDADGAGVVEAHLALP